MLASCDKSYKYVEIIDEKSMFDDSYESKQEEPEQITAKNDSIAYIKAFEKFCISVKVWRDMAKKGMVLATVPKDFKIYNQYGKEVYVGISNKILDSIQSEIMGLGSSFTEYQENETENHIIDTLKVEELSPLFNFKKDEFDPNGITWIKPKTAPKYTNRNGIYCYFSKDNFGVSNFRFRIQYHDDDWLFIEKYQFSIDGKAYEYIPVNVERDSGNGGMIWEWSDERVSTYNDKEILEALSNANVAKIKFIGSQYYDIRTITRKELQSIKNAIDLFKAMGGVL